MHLYRFETKFFVFRTCPLHCSTHRKVGKREGGAWKRGMGRREGERGGRGEGRREGRRAGWKENGRELLHLVKGLSESISTGLQLPTLACHPLVSLGFRISRNTTPL